MDIRNKTSRPLRIQLAGNKRLFLTAGGLGQVAPKAVEESPLKELVEDGSIEIQGVQRGKRGGDGGSSGVGPASAGPSKGAARRTGDS